MKIKEIKKILKTIVKKYPLELIPHQLDDINRIAFHIWLVINNKGRDITICDIGGGVGLFSVGCAAMGMNVTLVDDFKDEINLNIGTAVLDLHRYYGVKIINKNVIDEHLDLGFSSFDAVTTFNSMEHWHNSPKRLFFNAKKALRNDGLLILGVPNCVNMRKRLTVPFGNGKWSKMKEWYESDIFRGHVREPDIKDLLYIGKDLGLRNVKILGRNWSAYMNKTRFIHIKYIALCVDYLLRINPSFCSDIYLVGKK